ncbi:MAG: class I SAM-dependent methyltransferase [Eubacteriales bacterium]
MVLHLLKELSGNILDIGGGGEGIIGRLYREQVTAIDNRQEELDEAPNVCKKVLMDATDLKYEANSFDNVTFFFTLMFMQKEEQRKAIGEATRVLKSGGEIHIWDCNIVSAYPVPFCVDVVVQMPHETINTTYGIGKLDSQDMRSIIKMCEDEGLTLNDQQNDEYFYLKMKK